MDVWDYGDEEQNSLEYWGPDGDEDLDSLEGSWEAKDGLTSSSNMMEVWEYCVIPVLQQSFLRLFPIIGFAVIAGEILQRGWVKVTVAKNVCVISGAMIIGHLVNLPEAILFVMVMVQTYAFILISARFRSSNVYISVFLVGLAYLIFREHVPLFENGSWAQVRGIVMIGFMKTLSLVFELTHSQRMNPPSPTEYLAYIFFPGTVAFGPWVSYSELARRLGRMHLQTNYTGWFLHAICKILLASMHLVLSTCFIHFCFTGVESGFFLFFRDAAMVRFSHYFICRLSEALYFLAGPRSPETGLRTPVVNELNVEFPRSLVDVVVNWNIPMHRWLKKYVYNPLLTNVGRTKAGLITFLVSAMLHGLNFRLSAVLMSLALFCYIECSFRQTFSDITSCCVQARSCRGCDHIYRNDLLVQLLNFGFLLLALFNLAYLGVLLDNEDEPSVNADWSSSVGQKLLRWSEFNYCGHTLMFGLLISDFILRLFLQIF